MKTRRLLPLLLTLLLLVTLPLAVFAAEDDSDAKLRYMTDAANLLTSDQDAALEARAQEISQEYSFSVYLIVVDDYTTYSKASSIEDACIDIYDSYELGWGPDKAGATLMLSMAERDFNLDFNSDRADAIFTEAGRDYIEDRILPYFRDNDYYGGFNEYLNCCEEYLEAARNGTPIGEGLASRNDQAEEESSLLVTIVFFCLPGLFAAAVTAVVLIVPMHSAGTKNQADDYVVPGSMRLTRQSDHFLRRTVTRTPRQTEKSSSGGSGSVSTSYSSGSHSGRSGKF